ncbi:MAG: carbohydrate kinase family protein [Candidatus Nomurabacteria bacterium]
MEKSYDIIAIGDTVVDVFIKLDIGHVQETATGAELCLPYGAKIPYVSAIPVPAVGNSANAAVSASRLGLSAALITFLGKDEHGEECLARLKEEKVSTEFITQEDGKPTNYHYVLWYGDDRTILIKHSDFFEKLPENLLPPKWIYLSSLGAHTEAFHDEITDYVEKNPDVKLAFQPGTFQLRIHDELIDLYKRVEVLCMNKEESQEILKTPDEHEIKILLDGLESFGPKTVIITDGHSGAYMKYENTYFNMPIFPDIAPPLERTGAGDAFFSTFISYLAKGFDPAYAIRRAPVNSMNVVQHVGAQEGLLTESAIEELLKKAPEDYKLKILE